MQAGLEKVVAKTLLLREQATESISKGEEALLRLVAYQKDLDEAQAIVQKVAKETQEELRFSLENVVNSFLTTVFDGAYSFQLVYEIKRDKTEARIVILDDGEEIDPFDTGGGLADVLALALRVAMLMLSPNRRILILDEPWKNIDEVRKPLAFEVLHRLATDLGIQILAVTHDKLLIAEADKVYKVTKQGRISYATSV